MPLHLRPLDLSTVDSLDVESYAIFVGEDERPLYGLGGLLDWRMVGGLSRYLREQRLSGSRDEVFLTPAVGPMPGMRIFAFGLGPLEKVTAEGFLHVSERAIATLAKAKVTTVAIGLPERPPLMSAARSIRQSLNPLQAAEVYLLGTINELERAILGN